jgi:hypothetical protein
LVMKHKILLVEKHKICCLIQSFPFPEICAILRLLFMGIRKIWFMGIRLFEFFEIDAKLVLENFCDSSLVS